MKQFETENMNDVIDRTLSDEAMIPVPEGLADRIEASLHIAAIIEWEKRRVRAAAMTTLCLAVGLIVLSVAGIFLSGLPVRYLRETPGFQGVLDYWLAAQAPQIGAGQMAIALTSMAVIVGAIVLIVAGNMRKTAKAFRSE